MTTARMCSISTRTSRERRYHPVPTESGSGITINNGVTTSSSNLGAGSWITTSSTYGLSANQILELYEDYTGANGNDCSLNSGYVSHPSTQCDEGPNGRVERRMRLVLVHRLLLQQHLLLRLVDPFDGGVPSSLHLLALCFCGILRLRLLGATQQITSQIPGSQAYIGVSGFRDREPFLEAELHEDKDLSALWCDAERRAWIIGLRPKIFGLVGWSAVDTTMEIGRHQILTASLAERIPPYTYNYKSRRPVGRPSPRPRMSHRRLLTASRSSRMLPGARERSLQKHHPVRLGWQLQRHQPRL